MLIILTTVVWNHMQNWTTCLPGSFLIIWTLFLLCFFLCHTILLVQVHPGVAKWKNTHLPCFKQLSVIFWKDRATAKFGWESWRRGRGIVFVNAILSEEIWDRIVLLISFILFIVTFDQRVFSIIYFYFTFGSMNIVIYWHYIEIRNLTSSS